MTKFVMYKLFLCLISVVVLGCDTASSQSDASSTGAPNAACVPEYMMTYLPPYDDVKGTLDPFQVGQLCNGESSRGADSRVVSFISEPSSATIKATRLDTNDVQTCVTPCWLNVDDEQDLNFEIIFPNGHKRDVPIAFYEDKSVELGVWLTEEEEMTLYLALMKDLDIPLNHFTQEDIVSWSTQRNRNKTRRVMEVVMEVTKEDCIYYHDYSVDGLVVNLAFGRCGDVATRKAVMDWLFSGRSKIEVKTGERGYVLSLARRVRYLGLLKENR